MQKKSGYGKMNTTKQNLLLAVHDVVVSLSHLSSAVRLSDNEDLMDTACDMQDMLEQFNDTVYDMFSKLNMRL